MLIVEEKIVSNWKEEETKVSSFDDAFEELGINGSFVDAKEIKSTLDSPTASKTDVKSPVESEKEKNG